MWVHTEHELYLYSVCMQITDVFIETQVTPFWTMQAMTWASTQLWFSLGNFWRSLSPSWGHCWWWQYNYTEWEGRPKCLWCDETNNVWTSESENSFTIMTQEHNTKDKLYSVVHVVKNLRHRGLQWRSNEVEPRGINLWDHSLKNYHILTVTMTHFLVMDTWFFLLCHLSKLKSFRFVVNHCKRAAYNMTVATLEALAEKLFAYCMREGWG